MGNSEPLRLQVKLFTACGKAFHLISLLNPSSILGLFMGKGIRKASILLPILSIFFTSCGFLGHQTSILIENTSVSGKLRNNELWRGKITLTGDVWVPPDVTLRLTPETTIFVDPRKDDQHNGLNPNKVEIIVEGSLVAVGTPTRPIKITLIPDKAKQFNTWYGMVFRNVNGQSLLKHVQIKHVEIGISFIDSSVLIQNCTIQSCSKAAISCEGTSAPIIQDCVLIGSKRCIGGIEIHDNSKPQILNNIIEGFTYHGGILIDGRSKALIKGNEIKNNHHGIRGGHLAEAIVLENVIKGNSEFGITMWDSLHIILKKNTITDNGRSGISVHDTAVLIAANGANCIMNNRHYNLANYTPFTIDATGNYWGTADLEVIKSRNRGVIHLEPFLVSEP